MTLQNDIALIQLDQAIDDRIPRVALAKPRPLLQVSVDQVADRLGQPLGIKEP